MQLDYQAMRNRDLANRAKKHAHKVQPEHKPTRLEDVLRSAKQREREQVLDAIKVYREQLAYAKEMLALIKPFLQMWEAEVQQRGQWMLWARGQAERLRDQVASLERGVRKVTNDLRGKEAHLAWLDRRAKVTNLQRPRGK